MASERPYVTPLMAELDATRQKLAMATRNAHPDQKQISSLALIQAHLLTKFGRRERGTCKLRSRVCELGAAQENRETQAGQ